MLETPRQDRKRIHPTFRFIFFLFVEIPLFFQATLSTTYRNVRITFERNVGRPDTISIIFPLLSPFFSLEAASLHTIAARKFTTPCSQSPKKKSFRSFSIIRSLLPPPPSSPTWRRNHPAREAHTGCRRVIPPLEFSTLPLDRRGRGGAWL